MKRENVISGSVHSIGWEDGKMEVEFPNGSVYLYDDISLDTYQKIRIGKSIGSLLRSEVINQGNIGKKVIPKISDREQTSLF
jgi:KTSC domain